jgi:transposase
MALGKRKFIQRDLFVATTQIAHGPGHPFYAKLNEVLAAAGFDRFVEELCAPHYKEGGRPGIPPGIYFRMVLIGYFEGIDSQRGIAWRCADSMALRAFLGVELSDRTPVHASMSVIRQRLPGSVFNQVFGFVLQLLSQHRLLQGKALGIDATTLEANAAMKSIVRKDGGDNWNEYLRKLAQAEGIDNPTQEDLRRMDRQRTDKKVSNEHWESPSDPEARIAKMKDGRTHLAYKAEHAVDLKTEAIVAVQVTYGDRSDSQTGLQTLRRAKAHLIGCGRAEALTQVVMDKGYHDNRLLVELGEFGVRTYVPERKQKSRCWTDKPVGYERAFRRNRLRVRGAHGRELARLRSERCERSFAHVCETGGGRRTWVRGVEEVSKLHQIKCAGFNLGLLLRKVWGYVKPRSRGAWRGLFWALGAGLCGVGAAFGSLWTLGVALMVIPWLAVIQRRRSGGACPVKPKNTHSSTGC